MHGIPKRDTECLGDFLTGIPVSTALLANQISRLQVRIVFTFAPLSVSQPIQLKEALDNETAAVSASSLVQVSEEAYFD